MPTICRQIRVSDSKRGVKPIKWLEILASLFPLNFLLAEIKLVKPESKYESFTTNKSQLLSHFPLNCASCHLYIVAKFDSIRNLTMTEFT